MDQFRNWLVCLDMTETDNYVVRNVARLVQIFQPESITFLHIVEPTELPREVMQEIPDLHAPELKYYQDRIEALINEFRPDTDTQVNVAEGHVLTSILRKADEGNFDLVVVGKKGNEGLVERKIARKSGISVLFIPENERELKDILVPVDFSEYSRLALQAAEQLSPGVEGVSCLHIYRDSSKYISQVVETVDDVHEMLSKRSVIDEKLAAYAKHKLAEFLEEFKSLDPEFHIVGINKSLNIGEYICQWTESHHADMLIIGARGKSAAAAALLGAVSETIYSNLTDRYLLVIKQPGENVGLIRALLGK